MCSSDLDAYHLSLWAGCGGALQPIKRPIITSRGPWQPSEVTWSNAMVNGCVPSTCRGGCDKGLSCIVIDGHVFRFAACQFGQKTAGSPLGSIVRAVARFFARLTYPVHVAAWVDDLIFVMSTPAPRGPAGGEKLVGGGGAEGRHDFPATQAVANLSVAAVPTRRPWPALARVGGV